MKLISALVLSLLFFPIRSQADFAYFSNRHLANSSELIVVGRAKVVEKGRFYGYKQKVYFEVESTLKGSSQNRIVVLGRIDFECDMTNYKNGKYLLFLRQRKNNIFELNIVPTYESVNFENGIREVIGNKIWWSSEKLLEDPHSYKNLELIIAEVSEFALIPWGNNIY